jgi:hypothetical protein
VATDAAREGINLQAHCYNLFHFDVPWNPSRLEQRNGRIDRKLQPAPEVFCHYFVYQQRPEDRVLQALVRKTGTIRDELGSLSEVLEARLADTLKAGIRHEDVGQIVLKIDDAALDADKRKTVEEELESERQRKEQLRSDVALLQRRVEDSRRWIGLDMESLRDALSCSLEMIDSDPLRKADGAPKGEPDRFVFPNLDTRKGGDPTWATTLDTLRAPPEDGEKGFQWRKNAPIRPVVFNSPSGIDESVVQLHLHHRVVQRLLGRFLSQGFVHHDLSRACLAQSQDNIPRVVLLGRLSLYGPGATRLHEEILTVTARWVDPASRKGALAPYARDAEARTVELLEVAVKPGSKHNVPDAVVRQLLAAIPRDIEDLLPHLQERGQTARADAEKALTERGQIESESMRRILEEQKKRILAELDKPAGVQLRLFDSEEERRQYESNRRYWERWMSHFQSDMEREPARILDFYRVNSSRVEPIGVAYLYPAAR